MTDKNQQKLKEILKITKQKVYAGIILVILGTIPELTAIFIPQYFSSWMPTSAFFVVAGIILSLYYERKYMSLKMQIETGNPTFSLN